MLDLQGDRFAMMKAEYEKARPNALWLCGAQPIHRSLGVCVAPDHQIWNQNEPQARTHFSHETERARFDRRNVGVVLANRRPGRQVGTLFLTPADQRR